MPGFLCSSPPHWHWPWPAAAPPGRPPDEEEGSPGAALHVETAVAPTGEGSELIVEVAEPDTNVPERAGNRKSVTLECLGETGAVRRPRSRRRSRCQSWYLDDTGRNSTSWPSFSYAFRRRTERFDPEAYEVSA